MSAAKIATAREALAAGVARKVNTYAPVATDCEHHDTYGHRGSCDACAARWDAAGHATGLGVAHMWNNIGCPAYRSLRPSDCTCRS